MNQVEFQSQLQMIFEASKIDFCKNCKHDWFDLADFAQESANRSTFIESISNCWRVVNYVREFESERYFQATDFCYEITGGVHVQGIDLEYAIQGVASAVFYFALYDRFADYWEALKEGQAFPEFNPRT